MVEKHKYGAESKGKVKEKKNLNCCKLCSPKSVTGGNFSERNRSSVEANPGGKS